MQKIKSSIKVLFFIIVLTCFSPYIFAHETPSAKIIPRYEMSKFDNEIARIYAILHANEINDITNRIEVVSRFFLGRKVVIGSTGDGQNARFDHDPIYRTDEFDCLSYVNIVIAIAESDNLTEFKTAIKKINYHDGKVDFFNRFHFLNTDWNRENTKKQGYLKDFTKSIVDENNCPVARISTTIIDKPSWYEAISTNRIKYFQSISPTQTKQLLHELHSYSTKVKKVKSIILYIPLDELFNKKGNPNMFLFNQIPTSSLIEIIRPNWDLNNEIGTNLDVSHLGFAIRNEQGLMFREASSSSMWKYGVRDVPLVEYLKSWLNDDTVKGINVLIIK